MELQVIGSVHYHRLNIVLHILPTTPHFTGIVQIHLAHTVRITLSPNPMLIALRMLIVQLTHTCITIQHMSIHQPTTKHTQFIRLQPTIALPTSIITTLPTTMTTI